MRHNHNAFCIVDGCDVPRTASHQDDPQAGPHAGPGFDAIAFHARFRPDSPACIDLASGERVTYSAFDRRVSQAARRLADACGDVSGARIAAIARNSSCLAILGAACERAGAIFVPLNWRLAEAELADLIADCEPALIACDDEFAAVCASALKRSGLASVVSSPAALAGSRAPAPRSRKRPQQAAMTEPCIILYTSGTTGRPKGVVITRENALWSSMNFSALARITPASVILCDSPMFHTVGLVAITRTALMQGGCVAISDRFAPGATLSRLSDPSLGVTHYFVVPQMVEALLREPGAGSADFSRLTALFSGGGPLHPALVEQCVQRGVLLVNGYGMSEAGSVIHMPLDAGYMAANTHAVGFAAPWIHIRLAGAGGQPVANGETGEVWVSGPSVSPGYWRQPEATEASRSGAWFRTGDLARQQADGSYVIVDRLKDMYISGGENVYPAEVEAVLKSVEGIDDAAVVGVPDERWGEVGCAFIQTRQPHDAVARAVRTACGARLARFKQPARIEFIEAIPRTGSGKALKASLRSLAASPAAAPAHARGASGD